MIFIILINTFFSNIGPFIFLIFNFYDGVYLIISWILNNKAQKLNTYLVWNIIIESFINFDLFIKLFFIYSFSQ